MQLLTKTEGSGGVEELGGAADGAIAILKSFGYLCFLLALLACCCWPLYKRYCQPKSSTVDEQPAGPDLNAIAEESAVPESDTMNEQSAASSKSSAI